jgi:hypothetical protein
VRENTNLKTGIRYGVTDNIDHDLLDTIMTNGTDLTRMETFEEAGLWDNDDEQHDYEHELDSEHGPVKLILTTLGGAPLLYVIESPYVMACRGCSPCVPNAGDLNAPQEYGTDAYCLPDAYREANQAAGSIRLLDEETRQKHSGAAKGT